MKLPGWRRRLSDTIDGFRRRPFAWGAADCAALAAAAIVAQTGKRPGLAHWYRYRTERGALGVLRRAGCASLADLAATVLPEVHPARATTGDIAAIPIEGPFGFALGVVVGDRIFVFGRAHDGLGHVDLLDATRAFRVGS